MSDSVFKVTLDEITPEKLIEIEAEMQNNRLIDLTIANLKTVGARRQGLQEYLTDVENECKSLCLRAIGLGITKKQLSQYFGVSLATVNSWMKGISDV